MRELNGCRVDALPTMVTPTTIFVAPRRVDF
jgi:hypothetical protein